MATGTHRVTMSEKFADELIELAGTFRNVADSGDFLAVSLNRDIERTIELANGGKIAHVASTARILATANAGELFDLHDVTDLHNLRWFALDLASRLEDWAHGVRAGVLLGLLARFLPGDERTRFVAEAIGNLGDCEHWWQRVDHLIGLAVGTPRLAWMMHRDNRRGRA